MTTAIALITRAHRLLGVASSGETLSADEAANGLEALNAMLDSWRNERLMVYAIRDEYLTMTPGTQSYSIGPSGDLDTDRPVKIDSAYVRSGGYDYGVKLVNEHEWYGIVDKGSEADFPDHAYYEPTLPTGTIYVWPKPTQSDQLHILTWTPLESFTSLSDDVTMPPGYERTIVYNLAPELSPEFGVTPSNIVIGIATSSKAAIKRANSKPIKASPSITGFGHKKTNIITDA